MVVRLHPQARRGERPKRGVPAETRARIVAAAASEFRTGGYFGTDSNVIARAAGYAPGTFYKHFADKRAAFMAVYTEWIRAQWKDFEAIARRQLPQAETAARFVDLLLVNHREWRVFRASLTALVATDPVVRRHHRDCRKRQVKRMTELLGGSKSAREALGLLVIEHIADAVVDGETDAIGVPEAVAREHLVTALMRMPKPRRTTAATAKPPTKRSALRVTRAPRRRA